MKIGVRLVVGCILVVQMVTAAVAQEFVFDVEGLFEETANGVPVRVSVA